MCENRAEDGNRAATSRRTVLKSGLLSTGALVGTAGIGTADESTDDSTAGHDEGSSPRRTAERAVMFSYQWTPGSRVTIDESLAWQPRSVEGAYETYRVTYDRVPSYQAYLFADGDSEERDGTGREGAALQPGDAVSIGAVRGSPAGTKRRYVSVGLECEPALTVA